MDGLLIWLQKYKYYFDTQNINLKNDRKRSALPLCKAKNRPHDIPNDHKNRPRDTRYTPAKQIEPKPSRMK